MLRLSKATALSALLLAACTLSHNPELSPGHAQSAAITVNNDHTADVSVYADADPLHVRLGTVEMFGTRTFVLPRAITLPCEVRIHVVSRIDGQEFMTPVFLPRYGDFFVVNVENAMQYSSLLRRH